MDSKGHCGFKILLILTKFPLGMTVSACLSEFLEKMIAILKHPNTDMQTPQQKAGNLWRSW